MAHIVFATRGVKHEVDLFVATMQGQYFPWKRKNLKTGEDETSWVQGALRPMQLWEYIVPDDAVDLVLTSLDIDENGKVHPFAASFNAKMLRKTMGLEPVKYKKTPTRRVIPRQGVALYPIGLKKDVKYKWEEQGYEQEML